MPWLHLCHHSQAPRLPSANPPPPKSNSSDSRTPKCVHLSEQCGNDTSRAAAAAAALAASGAAAA